ncbi:MarR family transcriptional regulator [Thauera phenylacetica B4P]|uniref:MarR family transcriptional regulator n=1 Tax=Thauera phenylacetica B4P TaxID=1234382 RepID=N6ZZE4_9RHOO|nr:MarR family transcriptional regulator [Thauera phenylacetica]ENO97509.1 MarR family transcriptional regulator [Thauera phenylacetica B4P]
MGAGNDNLTVPTSAESITFGMLPELIGYRLRIAQIGIFRDFCTSVDEPEITPTLFGALVLIDANPGMKQTQLADAIQLDRSSVVSVLDKLEARGLVERVRAPENRRANALHLTTEGRRILDSLIPQVRAHEERVLRNLDPAERAQLQKLLGRLVLAAG